MDTRRRDPSFCALSRAAAQSSASVCSAAFDLRYCMRERFLSREAFSAASSFSTPFMLTRISRAGKSAFISSRRRLSSSSERSASASSLFILSASISSKCEITFAAVSFSFSARSISAEVRTSEASASMTAAFSVSDSSSSLSAAEIFAFSSGIAPPEEFLWRSCLLTLSSLEITFFTSTVSSAEQSMFSIAADTPEVSGSFVPSWRMKTVFTKTSSGIPKKYSPGSQFILTIAPVPRSTVTVRSLTGALSEPSETTSDLSIR